MRRMAVALIAAVLALPAAAQVDCGAPVTGKGAKYAEDYARKLTLPLIEHNAAGLGPVVWTYIAGQAQGEGPLTDASGNFRLKQSLNLWNMQSMPIAPGKCAAGEVVQTTDVACKEVNPTLVEKKTAQLGQCWESSEGEAMRSVSVCMKHFPNLDAAADAYVAFKPTYTTALQDLAKGTPSRQEFMDALDLSKWADKPNRAQYRKDTLAAIERALRGLATVREKDTNALAEASGSINAWCAQPGIGDAGEREALRARQKALLATLATVGGVCTALPDSKPPTANGAIDTCRMQRDPPPPEPTGPAGHGGASGQGPSDRDRTGGSDHRPSGYATGTGEPHYRLPGGLRLSTQRAGEFWLLDAPDGTRIQVRQVPWGQSREVAAIGAIAAQVGAQRIGVYADGRVMVGGEAMQWTGRFHQRALGSDAVIGVWGPQERPSQVAVMWRNGRTLRIHLRSSWLDIETSWARGTAVANDQGLIGQASSNAQGALIGRDNRRGQLANADQADAFVTSWRIQAKESLFDYQAGESVATFDLRGFPEKPAEPTRAALEAARAACLAAGVQADRLDACAFDLAVTGSKEFLASHLPALAAASTPPEPKVAPLGTHPALFTPDIANPVQTLPNGSRFDTNIGAGEQRTYRIDANRGDPPVFLNVISNNLSCVAEEVDGSKPAYQLFDARGRAISKAKPTCADLFTADVAEGDYYLVIKGAKADGPMEVSLEAWAN
jgi:hypothetical protein